MPLWNVYCSQGVYSADDKRALAEAITDIYASAGMPRFYVGVVFHEMPTDSLFIGGTPRDNFVRISIDHIARTAAQAIQSLANRVENALALAYIRFQQVGDDAAHWQ